MNTPQGINPLDTAMVCPNCKANASCVNALANNAQRFYTYICTCGAILILAEAESVGTLTRPGAAGIEQVIGLILFKSQGKIVVPGKRIPMKPIIS